MDVVVNGVCEEDTVVELQQQLQQRENVLTEQIRSEHLREVLKDPVKEWKLISQSYRNDKKLILAVLLDAKELPPKSDFERRFPQVLRFDRDVVLAFCQRHDLVDLYFDRLLFVPGCRTSDKEVMMAYCRKIPRSLQDCSEELTDDPENVLTAIAANGLELQYASPRLRED